jgi:hypothetical protein
MLPENNHNSASIKSLVKSEMERITNPIVKNALEDILVNPIQHMRKWDYGTKGEEFVCWTVAIDKNSDTALVYSDYGFGPESPWGLVFQSYLYFGMDTGWFTNLKDSFLDSTMSSELLIWNVEKKINAFSKELIAANLTLKESFALRDKMTLGDSAFVYTVTASEAAK